MATSYIIDIDGQLIEASSVTLPSTGREFRGAWSLNGDVIEIDMAKAIDIKIEKIVQKAFERAEKAEEKAMKNALKGEDTTLEDAEIAKFKSKPKQAAVNLILGATTPEELDAITEDDIYE